MLSDTLRFIGLTARRWRTMGAVVPSGGNLSRAMARQIGPLPEGKIILELGPGTGVVTKALREEFPKSQILAIEINEPFIEPLRKNFPGVTVIQGCASQLETILAQHGLTIDDVGVVVSGLPLLSLPGDLPQRILQSIARVLRPGRPYVQFTYSERAWRRFTVDGFHRKPSKRVWLNVPPAFVLHFVRDEQSHA